MKCPVSGGMNASPERTNEGFRRGSVVPSGLTSPALLTRLVRLTELILELNLVGTRLGSIPKGMVWGKPGMKCPDSGWMSASPERTNEGFGVGVSRPVRDLYHLPMLTRHSRESPRRAERFASVPGLLQCVPFGTRVMPIPKGCLE